MPACVTRILAPQEMIIVTAVWWFQLQGSNYQHANLSAAVSVVIGDDFMPYKPWLHDAQRGSAASQVDANACLTASGTVLSIPGGWWFAIPQPGIPGASPPSSNRPNLPLSGPFWSNMMRIKTCSYCGPRRQQFHCSKIYILHRIFEDNEEILLDVKILQCTIIDGMAFLAQSNYMELCYMFTNYPLAKSCEF